jgi:cell division protein FtsL
MEESLLRVQKNLSLDEATLSSPGRIDLIARNELKMAPLLPSQQILSPVQNGESNANVLAMANSQAVSLKKPALVGISGSNQND